MINRKTLSTLLCLRIRLRFDLLLVSQVLTAGTGFKGSGNEANVCAANESLNRGLSGHKKRRFPYELRKGFELFAKIVKKMFQCLLVTETNYERQELSAPWKQL